MLQNPSTPSSKPLPPPPVASSTLPEKKEFDYDFINLLHVFATDEANAKSSESSFTADLHTSAYTWEVQARINSDKQQAKQRKEAFKER